MLHRLVICIALLMPAIYAQGNPLLSPAKSTEKDPSISHASHTSSPRGYLNRVPFLKGLLVYQKKLNAYLCERLRRIGEGFSIGHAFVLFALAFLYGIIHSLGPGHAKLIIGSYMLTRNHRMVQSLVAGSVFAATHAGMAVAIYLLLRLVFHFTRSSTESVSAGLYNISGFFVAAIGIAFLIQALMSKRSTTAPAEGFDAKYSLPLLSFASGLMPCPGTLLLLIFSQLAGVAVYGLLSAFFLSLGMAVTVSSVAGLAILARRTISFSTQGKHLEVVLKSIRISGAAVIVVIGSVMCVG